jgi:hypothetical protein
MGPAWPGDADAAGPANPRQHAPFLRLSRVEYEPVKHSHVVPAGYLRAWADGRQIAMRLVGAENSLLVSVRDAGVRSDYYRLLLAQEKQAPRPAFGELQGLPVLDLVPRFVAARQLLRVNASATCA